MDNRMVHYLPESPVSQFCVVILYPPVSYLSPLTSPIRLPFTIKSNLSEIGFPGN